MTDVADSTCRYDSGKKTARSAFFAFLSDSARNCDPSAVCFKGIRSNVDLGSHFLEDGCTVNGCPVDCLIGKVMDGLVDGKLKPGNGTARLEKLLLRSSARICTLLAFECFMGVKSINIDGFFFGQGAQSAGAGSTCLLMVDCLIGDVVDGLVDGKLKPGNGTARLEKLLLRSSARICTLLAFECFMGVKSINIDGLFFGQGARSAGAGSTCKLVVDCLVGDVVGLADVMLKPGEEASRLEKLLLQLSAFKSFTGDQSINIDGFFSGRCVMFVGLVDL